MKFLMVLTYADQKVLRREYEMITKSEFVEILQEYQQRKNILKVEAYCAKWEPFTEYNI